MADGHAAGIGQLFGTLKYRLWSPDLDTAVKTVLVYHVMLVLLSTGSDLAIIADSWLTVHALHSEKCATWAMFI